MTLLLREFERLDVLYCQGIDLDQPEYGPALGLTAVDGDTIVGYAAILCVNGRDWLAFWWRGDRPRTVGLLHRNGVRLFKALRGSFSEVYTICDSRHPSGDRWHRRLGFQPLLPHEKDFEIEAYERQQNGGAYRWLR